MRSGRFRITAASLLAFALGAAATPARAADPIPFKIGISAPVVTIFPVWMGEAGASPTCMPWISPESSTCRPRVPPSILMTSTLSPSFS